MVKSIDTDVFMQTNFMIDCRMMAARIIVEICGKY